MEFNITQLLTIKTLDTGDIHQSIQILTKAIAEVNISIL